MTHDEANGSTAPQNATAYAERCVLDDKAILPNAAGRLATFRKYLTSCQPENVHQDEGSPRGVGIPNIRAVRQVT